VFMSYYERLKNKNVVLLCRASKLKQEIKGDSLDSQLEQGVAFIKAQGGTLVKMFPLIESGAGDNRAYFREVLDYCKNRVNKVDAIVFRDISRFTRSGSRVYSNFKVELRAHGVDLVDMQNIIQPEINTLEHLGFEYDWSRYSPSEQAEIAEAERHKAVRRDILTLMVSAQIRYVQKGFMPRRAPYGLENVKIDTEHGERSVPKPRATEFPHIKKMFDLAATGIYTDQEIVEILNKDGYRSRRIRYWDRQKGVVKGYGGELPLTVKQLRKYLQNTIYCSILFEKWTGEVPVKMPIEPAIPISVFNKANAGQIRIVEEDGKVQIFRSPKKWKWTKRHAGFPYKGIIRCSVCGKDLKASLSRGKSKKYFGYYHCSRNHGWCGVPAKELESNVEAFISGISLNSGFYNLFKEITLDVWEEKKATLYEATIQQGQRTVDIQKQTKLIMEKIKILESPTAIKELEKDLEKLEFEKAQAEDVRNDSELKGYDLRELHNRTKSFMEHPGRWILNAQDYKEKSLLTELLFEGKPTYEEILGGTPKLSPVFALSKEMVEGSLVDANTLVTPRGIEPRFPG
jgi:hypothetical protein